MRRPPRTPLRRRRDASRQVGLLARFLFPVALLFPGSLATPLGVRPAAAQAARPTCESCHGELELLRQHVATLDQARALLSPADTLAASAHGAMTCVDCHDGFRRYPHRKDATTRTCTSCHAAATAAWQQGMHALDTAAACNACHGTHDVLPRAALHTPEGARAMRRACASCHYEPASATSDPHADSVSCAACHEPHRTLPTEDERSTTNALNQAQTCGACHDREVAQWRDDAHGRAVAELKAPGGARIQGSTQTGPPTCSACHGAHGMLSPSQPGFGAAMVARCGSCHAPWAESFADSYHGQASTLGSPMVATCQACHGAHDILPSSDSASTVSDARRLQTCRKCHPDATAGFALFQPHADHQDRARYPYVYWSYRIMTLLLTATFVLFGTHTVLWLARTAMDGLRGTSHPTRQDRGGTS